MGEIGDRPPFVGLRDAEQVGDPFGEPLDAQRRNPETACRCRSPRRGSAGRCAARDRLELELQFGVDGLKLLVDRLQLLLAGLQLLRGRAVFLIDRLQLLVRGAQFLLAASDSSRTVRSRACVSSSSCVRRRTVSSVACWSISSRVSPTASPSMKITIALAARSLHSAGPASPGSGRDAARH